MNCANAFPARLPERAMSDLSLSFAAYVAYFQEDAEGTLFDLQSLFLDEGTCVARIEFLRGLADKAADRPRFSPEWSAREFAAEIQSISRMGLFPAWERGLLAPARLLALTC